MAVLPRRLAGAQPGRSHRRAPGFLGPPAGRGGACGHRGVVAGAGRRPPAPRACTARRRGGMWAAAPLLLLLLLLLLGRRWRREAAALEPAGRAVLITGCDSGFGHLLALRLHRLGFTVFAGCLCPGGEGARRLQREAAGDAGRMRVLRLDVTRGRDVLAAKELVLSHLPERGERRRGGSPPPWPAGGFLRAAGGGGGARGHRAAAGLGGLPAQLPERCGCYFSLLGSTAISGGNCSYY